MRKHKSCFNGAASQDSAITSPHPVELTLRPAAVLTLARGGTFVRFAARQWAAEDGLPKVVAWIDCRCTRTGQRMLARTDWRRDDEEIRAVLDALLADETIGERQRTRLVADSESIQVEVLAAMARRGDW